MSAAEKNEVKGKGFYMQFKRNKEHLLRLKCRYDKETETKHLINTIQKEK